MANFFYPNNRAATLQEDKLRTLSALGKTTSKALINEALEYAFSDEVKPQDTGRLLGAGALLAR